MSLAKIRKQILMKNLKLFYASVLLITIIGCSKSESDTDDTSSYAMTAKINGTLHEMNNPFGTNEATGSFFSYYPDEDYIFLQGRFGGVLGNPEINIWINRNDLIVGKYIVGLDTDGVSTHIDLIDNSNDTFGNPIYENTVSGFIAISYINTTDKIIRGTFEFETNDGGTAAEPVNFSVTEGTFNYKYDVE